MFLNGLQLTSCFLSLIPVNKLKFRFEKYREFFEKSSIKRSPKQKGYCVNRYTYNLFYRVTPNLKIHLFIYRYFETYTSKDGMRQLISQLNEEFRDYVNVETIVFSYKVVNVACTFPLIEPRFNFLFSSETKKEIIHDLNVFFSNLEQPPQFNQVTDEKPNFVLTFKDLGSILIFTAQKRGSLMCGSIEKLLTIEALFSDFCSPLRLRLNKFSN